MASIISAGTTSGTALNMAGDTSGVLQLATNGSTTAITIDTSQNVGIGIDIGSSKLEVAGTSPNNAGAKATYEGTIKINENSLSSLQATGGLEFKGSVFGAGYGSKITGADDGQLLIGNRANSATWTERMRIDSSGNVGIGGTSGGQRLYVTTTSGTSAYFYNSSASALSSAAVLVGKGDNNSTTSNVLVQFLINGGATGSGQINANGANTAAFGSFSDARLKENIEPLPPQLNNILALKPSEFDYKDGSGHQIGFIAQEMQEIYPDVVGEDINNMLTITGWSKTEARLVKAIQEQQTIINDLTARITALEGAA